MSFWLDVAKVFTAFFIITDSLGNLPFFIGLTEGTSSKERHQIALTSILTGLCMLAFFALAGNLVLDLFNLTIDDIKIAGGILLLVISIEILMRGKVLAEHPDEIGVVPLGSPLLVGPGAITTVLVMTRIYQLPAIIVGVSLCFFLIWAIFYFSDTIFKYLGRNGTLIITKISAIIISAIAVRFIRDGIQTILGI